MKYRYLRAGLLLLSLPLFAQNPVVVDEPTTIGTGGITGDTDLLPYFRLIEGRVRLDLEGRALLVESALTTAGETDILVAGLSLTAEGSIRGEALALQIDGPVLIDGLLAATDRLLLTATGPLQATASSRIGLDTGAAGGGLLSLETCAAEITLAGLVDTRQSGGPPNRIEIHGGNLVIDGTAAFPEAVWQGYELFAGVRVLGAPGDIRLQGDSVEIRGYGHLPDPGASATFTGFVPIAGDVVPVTLVLSERPAGDGVDISIGIPEGEGDILGFFGNVTDESMLAGIAASDPVGLISDSQFSVDNVRQVGGGNNLNPVKNWDFGLKIGRQGSADGAVIRADFSLTGPGLHLAHLTRALNQGWLFGVRIQSTNGGEGSSKMGLRGPEEFDPARHLGTVAVDAANGGGTIHVHALTGDLLAYDHAVDNRNPDNGAGLIQLEARDSVRLATTGSVDSGDPPRKVIDNDDPGTSKSAAAGSTTLVAHQGAIAIAPAARLSATTSRGHDGVQQLSACASLPDPSLSDPPFAGTLECGSGPEDLFPPQPPLFVSTPVSEGAEGQLYDYAPVVTAPAGRPVRIDLVSGPEGMVFADGALAWTPTATQAGTYQVVLVANSGCLTAQQTYALTIADTLNLAPVFTSTPPTGAIACEGYQYAPAAVDGDGDTLTFALLDGPTGLDLVGGSLSWTPAFDAPGSYPVRLLASDGRGGEAEQAFSIEVAPPNNQPPVFTSTPPADVIASQPYAYAPVATDPEGDAIEFVLQSGPDGLHLDAGLLTWTPAEPGVFDVVLDATTTCGQTSQSFAVTVIPANQPPSIVSTPVTAVEVLNPYVYQVVAEDPDAGDSLVFSFDQAPAGMSIDAASGRIGWVPENDQAGTHTVQVRVTDNSGASATQNYPLVVSATVNRPPVITSAPLVTHLLLPAAGQGEPIDLSGWTVLDFDYGAQPQALWELLDGGASAFQHLNARPSMLLSDFDLGNDQVEGTWRVETSADDDYMGFVFGFQDPNHFYLFDWKQGSQDVALRGMSLKKFQLEAASVVALWPTYPPASHGENLYHNSIGWKDFVNYRFTLDFHPGEITVTVHEGNIVLDSFTVFDDTYTSGKFGFYNYSQEKIRYTGFTREILAERLYSYAATAVDPDADPLTWVLVSGPAGMTLDPNTGALAWPTTTREVGSHPVRIRVIDPGGLYDEQAYTLVVENEAPVITSDPATSARVDALYVYDVGAVDPTPDDMLTYALDQAPAGMTIDSATGRILFTPSAGQVGDHAVSVRVGDPQAHEAVQTFTLTVYVPENSAPRITSELPGQLVTGALFNFRMTAFDPDGDGISFSTPVAPEGLTINAATGLIAWQPDISGEARLTVDAHDPGGLYDSQSVTFLVIDNGAPVITSEPIATATVGRAYHYQPTAQDPDGDALTWQLLLAPPGMDIGPDGQLDWVPANPGSFRVILEVADAYQATVQSFDLAVDAFNNQAPAITSAAPAPLRQDVAFALQITAVDPDGDPLLFSLDQGPAGLTLTPDGLLTWLPETAGTSLLTFTVADPYGASDGRTWTLTVSANQPPVFTTTPITVAVAESRYSYTPQVTDPENDAVTLALVQAPAGMTLVAGSLDWRPQAGQVGSHPVRLEASDVFGATAAQAFTIQVSPFINQPPRITSEPDILTARNQSWSYQPAALDPDGGALTWSLTDGPADVAFDPASGHLAWTSATAGTFAFTLTVSDAEGASDSQFIGLQVQYQGNSAPVFQDPDPPVTAEAGILYSYDAEISDAEGFPITFSLVQAPQGVALDTTRGIVTWTPALSQLGEHAFTLRVTDAHGATADRSWQVSVSDPGDITPPQVFMNLDRVRLNPGQTVTMTVAAADNVALADVRMTLNGEPVALDAAHRAVYPASLSGVYTATGFAVDTAGNEATHSQTFVVGEPGDDQPPVAIIHSPGHDSVLSAPADVTITVQDEHLARWVLEVGKTGKDCFSVLAFGETEETEAVVAAFDPSLLPNGMYSLRLTAYDVNDQGRQDEAVIIVEGEFKIGRFTVGFRDLDIPLRGIPAQVNRIYDSTDKCPGDFGYGWSLADADVQASLTLGRALDLREDYYCITLSGNIKYPPYSSCSGQELPLYCTDQIVPHYVTVTMPDGDTHQFDLALNAVDSGQSCRMNVPPEIVQPQFIARDGTTSSLTILGNASLLFRNVLDEDTGASEWMALDSSGDPWSPDLFQLTTSDGAIFTISKTDGIQSITDLEGNQLSFGPGGISHSSGVAIPFLRDGEGRITRITDPDGATIHYAYDDRGDLVSVTDRLGNVTRYRYDDYHNLIEAQDPTGAVPAKFYYDDAGRLTAQEDAYGNRISYDHDIEGRQEIVTDRAGNPTVFVYDDWGQVLQVTDPLGGTTLYTYDANHNETSVTIAAGTPQQATTTRTYDANHNILTETNPLGFTVSQAFNDQNQLTVIEDVQGRRSTATYDNSGRPLSVTNPLGYSYTNTYFVDPDRRVLVISTTDPKGQTSFLEQNARGEIIREVNTDGAETTIDYDYNGNMRKRTGIKTLEDGTTTNIVWQYFYDSQDQLTRIESPNGSESKKNYDPMGREIAEIDALNNRKETKYDARGNIVSVRYPDGSTEQSSYDEKDRLVTVTNRSGKMTRYEYNATDRLIRVSYPDGGIVAQTYDDAGRLSATTDQRGFTTRFEYDLNGNQIAILDPLGNRKAYTYNSAGVLESVTDARGNMTVSEYDNKNRRTALIFPDDTRIETVYDEVDRRISETDQAGVTTYFEYDSVGRLVSVRDAQDGITEYEYDQQGYLTGQTDALGRRTGYLFDKAGRKTGRILPMGMSELKSYTPTGWLREEHDFNGNNTYYTYNSNGQEIDRYYDEGNHIVTAYDSAGKRTSVIDDRGETHFSYDLMDRLKHVENPNGTWVTYDYDLTGNRTAVITHQGTISFSYNASGNMTSVTDSSQKTTRYVYDASGNRILTVLPNNIEIRQEYDVLNRLIYLEYTNQAGALIESFSYILDMVGRRIGVTESGGRQVSYSYDELGRMLEERISDPMDGIREIGYTYDPVGNRLTKTEGGETTIYKYDANDRLVLEGANTYTYDFNGNNLFTTKTGFLTSYDYNAAGRLVTIQTPEHQISFSYDSDGNRVKKTQDGQEINFLVDINRISPEVLEEANENGDVTASYVHSDRLVSMNRFDKNRYYHYNGHGSTIALSDEDGQLTDEYQYDAFGEIISKAGSTQNYYLYTAEQFDANSGFYYLRSRYYNPAVGRFNRQDSWPGDIFEPLSLNKYLYANASPQNFRDPSGKNNISETTATTGIASSWAGVGNVLFTGYKVAVLTSAYSLVGYLSHHYYDHLIYTLETELAIVKSGVILWYYYEIWRNSPEFRNKPPGAHHTISFWGVSGQVKTPEKLIYEKNFGSKVTIRLLSGGLPGRVFQFRYKIGRNGTTGSGLFTFRLDHTSYEVFPPKREFHYHLIFGNGEFRQDEHRPLF